MFYVALENIRSLYNVGAIFRTCSFFGWNNVILVGYSGKHTLPGGKTILHPKLAKTELGSKNDLNITFLKTATELVKFAKAHKCDLVAVEQTKAAKILEIWQPPKDVILVFGNEVDGISKYILENANQIVEIKRVGTHNSLNVATSVGIVLYHSGALVKR